MKKTLLIALTAIALPIIGMHRTVAEQPKTHKIKVALKNYLTEKERNSELNVRFDETDKTRCESLGITWSKTGGIVPVNSATYRTNTTIQEYDLTKTPWQNTFTFFKKPSEPTDFIFFPSALPVDFVRKLSNGPVIIEKTNSAGEALRIEITAENIPSLPFTTSTKIFIGGAFVGIASFIAWLLATDDTNPYKAQILNFFQNLMSAKPTV